MRRVLFFAFLSFLACWMWGTALAEDQGVMPWAAEPTLPAAAESEEEIIGEAQTHAIYRGLWAAYPAKALYEEMGRTDCFLPVKVFESLGDGRLKDREQVKRRGPLYLLQTTYWAEESESSAELLDAGTARLTRATGVVEMADAAGKFRTIKENGLPARLSSAAVLRTEKGARARVRLGDFQDWDFGGNAQVQIACSATVGSTRAKLRLDRGLLIAHIRPSAGQPQQLEVMTPLGKISSEGGRLAVWCEPDRVAVYVQSGLVQLADPEGNVAGALSNEEAGALPCATVPTLDPAARAILLRRFLGELEPFNPRAERIRISQQEGKPVSSEDAAWLEAQPRVDWAMPLEQVGGD